MRAVVRHHIGKRRFSINIRSSDRPAVCDHERHRDVSGASSGFIVTMTRRQQHRSNTITAGHVVDLARSAGAAAMGGCPTSRQLLK